MLASLGPVVRQALCRFMLSSIVALLVVGIGTALVASVMARDLAVQEAEVRTAAIADSVVAPLVSTESRQPNGQSRDELDMVLRNRLNGGSLMHMTLWDESGQVIWTDQSDAVGRSELSSAFRSLLGTDDLRSAYADDSGGDAMLTVAVGALDADGVPLVLESDWSVQGLAVRKGSFLTRLLPLTLGSLVLFQAAVLPLALALARRVDNAQTERARLLKHALDAQDLERRRLTQDLHDGVIQDLTGIGYVLPSLAPALEGTSPGRPMLEQVTQTVQRDIAALRQLATDLYPPDLSGAGFLVALEALAHRADENGVRVYVSVDDEVSQASPDGNALIYRIVREALRNVVKHSGAQRADVNVRVVGTDVMVTVMDDGLGLHASLSECSLGLKLLTETLEQAGGHLSLRDGETSGVRLEATFPVAYAPASELTTAPAQVYTSMA